MWQRVSSYPDQVSGMDIYDAVLEHSVRTPDQFDSYLRRRGLLTSWAGARSGSLLPKYIPPASGMGSHTSVSDIRKLDEKLQALRS